MSRQTDRQTDRYISCLIVVAWCAATLPFLWPVYPWRDEAHAWSIATNVPWYHLFEMVRSDGHFFLWYFLLKCVNWLHLPYPIGMQLLNWGICVACVWLILFKTKWPIIVQAAICFSYTLFAVYPFSARPYGLVIFFLLLLVILYPARLKRPWLYAILLFFTAHTHLVGCIGAMGFGCIYALDLKNAYWKGLISRRAIIGGGIICCLTALCLAVETFGFSVPSYNRLPPLQNIYLLNGWEIVDVLLFLCFGICIWKSRRAVFFLSFTCLGWLCVHFFCYSLQLWHKVFFVVFMWLAFGIYWQERPAKKLSVKDIGAILLLCVACCMGYGRFAEYITERKDQITREDVATLDLEALRTSRVFLIGNDSITLVPYLQPKDVVFYSFYTGWPLYSVQYLKVFWKGKRWLTNYENFAGVLDRSRPNLLISPTKEIPSLESLRGRNGEYLSFRQKECFSSAPHICVFEIKNHTTSD